MVDDRREAGLAVLKTLFGCEPGATAASVDLMALRMAQLFGEVRTWPQLGRRDRELITAAVIAALGRQRRLRQHPRGAVNAGLSRTELTETFPAPRFRRRLHCAEDRKRGFRCARRRSRGCLRQCFGLVTRTRSETKQKRQRP